MLRLCGITLRRSSVGDVRFEYGNNDDAKDVLSKRKL